MPTNPKYKDDYLSFTPGQELPRISEGLDSVRAYQWEIHFLGLDQFGVGEIQFPQDLTLAAKQVSQVGFTVEDIEVHRVNDRVFYPGKPAPEELTVTFDNLFATKSGLNLWKWFTQIYDPLTGEMTKTLDGGRNGQFKLKKVDIIQLDNKLKPHTTMELYGVYPKSWKSAELNYSTNEFNTVEVTFRYDFMQVSDYNLA